MGRGTFLPLFAGLPSSEQARRLVEAHLMNPVEYAPRGEVGHWVTTTAKIEPTWEPRRYWRGPVWVNPNWMIYYGLLKYGYREKAEQIKKGIIELVSEHGFREYFDPHTGEGYGAKDFSWTAALLVDLINDTTTSACDSKLLCSCKCK